MAENMSDPPPEDTLEPAESEPPADTSTAAVAVPVDTGASRTQDDTDRLLVDLRRHGITYLSRGTISMEPAQTPLPPADLMYRFAANAEPRVRNVIIALVLLHPDLAEGIPAWAGEIAGKSAHHQGEVAEQLAALSKIERGFESDFADVLALLHNGEIELDRLDATFADVLPRLATEGLASLDLQLFAAHYRALREQVGAP